MASAASTKNTESSAPPPVSLTPQEYRATTRELIQAGVARLPALPNTLEEFDLHVPMQDGWQSRTKVVRPLADLPANRPLIVHFYGGGMRVGEPEHVLGAARKFAETFGAVVALPSYRLVPDVRWPVPYRDSWDALVWLSKHAEAELGANLDAGFIVGGVSAGGALAAVCGGLFMFPNSKEGQGAPRLSKPLTGQFLSVPCLAVEAIVPAEYSALFTSRQENREVGGFNTAAVELLFDGLQCTNYRSLWFSPITAVSSQEPQNKVPVYLEHCVLDPLRDDSTVYGKLLESRGVQIKMQLFPEDGHTSWTVMDMPSKAINPTIKEAQMAGMKWLLSSS